LNPICLDKVIFDFFFISFQKLFGGFHNTEFEFVKRGFRLQCYEIGGPDYVQEDPLKGRDNRSVLGRFGLSDGSFKTINAEITQETTKFFVSDAEGDPDRPSDGYSSVDDAIRALQEGKVRKNSKIHLFFLCFHCLP
jgi:3,4-dihydroxy 2-butanone 4-phosphate synthase / GTP cyclohydrolase II